MPATSAAQGRFRQWAAGQRHRAAQYVSLHNTIFGVDKYRYFIYRTRYVFITALLRTAMHLAELLLVVNVLPTAVQLLMITRLSGLAIEGGWWGATESMRKRIRWLRREDNLQAIQHEIEGWISLSMIMAVVTTIAAGIFAFHVVQTQSIAAGALAFAIGIQTAIRIINRTFYSGAYAIRRVFLPIELIVIPELVITAIGFLLALYIGDWSIPTCTLLATAVGTLVCYRYVKDVTDFLRITPHTLFSRRSLGKIMYHHKLLEILASGLAALCMRMHEVVLIATLQMLATKHGSFAHVLFPLYIVMPLVRGAASWGQVTYFDLTKYGLDCIHEFRPRFERLCLEFSFLLSFMFCGVAGALIMMFARDHAKSAAIVILPYIIVSAVFGFVLIALFSRRHYIPVFCLSCLHYAVFLFIITQPKQILPLWQVLVLSSTLPIIFGWLLLMNKWQPPEFAMLVYDKWLDYVQAMRDTMVVHRITLSPSVTGMARRRLVKVLLSNIRSGDYITTDPQGDILISMPEANFRPMITEAYWIRLGGGYITNVSIHHYHSGTRALQDVLAGQLTEAGEKEGKFNRAIRFFKDNFPEGLIQFPLEPCPGIVERTTSEERRIILHCAKSQLEGNKVSQPDNWHVSIGTRNGAIACIFLLPKTLATDRLRKWRQALAAA